MSSTMENVITLIVALTGLATQIAAALVIIRQLLQTKSTVKDVQQKLEHNELCQYRHASLPVLPQSEQAPSAGDDAGEQPSGPRPCDK